MVRACRELRCLPHRRAVARPRDGVLWRGIPSAPPSEWRSRLNAAPAPAAHVQGRAVLLLPPLPRRLGLRRRSGVNAFWAV
eukprot:4314570-Pyramimonas_sp.AAC.1